jgi:hypothetical protein
VKCIESEYTTQGEFLLWETSIPAVQKGSNASIRTFESVFKLLRDLDLISFQTWHRYSRIYKVGATFPNSKRLWVPAKIAKPYLLKLPVDPKHLSTKLLYHNVCYELQVELFKSGVFVYLNKNLDGPKFPSMLPTLHKILKSIRFRQDALLRLISKKHANPAVIKVFSHIHESVTIKNPKSLEYFVETKELLTDSGPQEIKMFTLNIVKLLTTIISKNKTIRNSLVRNSNKTFNTPTFLVSPTVAEVTLSKSKLYVNSSSAVSEKQQILDAFWNARKCVFGVYRTLQTSEGCRTYSSNLPVYFRRAVNTVKKAYNNIGVVYPIPPRTLFMALFAYYFYSHQHHRPSRTWFTTEKFREWVETFVVAYDEIEQFRRGAKQIGDRKITAGDKPQFDAMKKMFFRDFERVFVGRSVADVLETPHLDFYIDWCLFRAVSNFRIAKTYFEHRTGIEASLRHYVLAQVQFLRFRANITPIQLEWICEVDARLRMEQWIEDNDPDAYISRERKQQLAKFFAEQKMEASE